MTPTSMPDGLRVVTAEPFNAETPLEVLAEPITPTAHFYVRSNFGVPEIDATTWRLRIDGLVHRPATLTLDDIRALPSREALAVLECAGNGRKLMSPVPSGTAWGLGAVSAARFTGVSLADVLKACRVGGAAREVVFRGADSGVVDTGAKVRFERSLPLERALHPDTLLVWAMNGEPLTPAHGYPLRLVVPNWYAVASVKWLERITVVAEPFAGHFQTERYVYRRDRSYDDGTPVSRVAVRSLIASPLSGEVVDGGCVVRGMAWSGNGRIVRVAVSADEGGTWRDATLRVPETASAPTMFSFDWSPSGTGTFTLIARAEDESGAVQPLDSVWNELGYANNVVQRVSVSVRTSNRDREGAG